MRKNNWDEFCKKASAVMQDALDNKIPLEKASAFFEHSPDIANDDLRQYMVRVIWDIDGTRIAYMELMALLESRQPEEKLVEAFEL